MFRAKAKLLLILTAPLALSGCQSFLGIHFARSERVRAVPVQHSTRVASATEQGRQYLADGRTGLAVEAFQRALSSDEPLAPALNGLGVAYARLGRADVARNLFQEAMLVDPSDQRYAANLARAMVSSTPTKQPENALAAAKPAKASEPAKPEPGRLVRVSSNEYRINTVEPAAKGQAVDSRFKPLMKVELRASADASDKSPRQLAMNNPYVSGSKAELEHFRPVVTMAMPKAKPLEAGK